MAVQSHLPADSSHLTVGERADMVEDYAGAVDSQIVKTSIMRNFVNLKMLNGTDTRTVRRMGDSVLQNITDATAGTETAATKRNFDRAQVTVDTVLIARDAVSMLNELQWDVDSRMEIGHDHGLQLGKQFDAAMLAMGVKTALSTVTNGIADGAIRGNQGRDLGDAFKSGQTTTLTAALDEADPDKFYAAIASLVVGLQEEDKDTDSMALFLRPTEYDVLCDNDKLINRDFSKDNGDFADGTIKTVKGVPLVRTARLSDTSVDLSLNGGTGYVPTAGELKCKALIMHPTTLLGAEAIPLTSKIYWDDLRKAWYIDSWMSYGAAPRRPDNTGAVFSF